jgi:hypothetical protein
MKFFTLLALLFSLSTFAHDEGHGPAVKDAGLYGGILAPAMKESDLKAHSHERAVKFKAELIRAQDGTLTLYFHTPDMKKAEFAQFAEKAKVKMEVKKAGKYSYVGEFEMVKKGHSYTGKLPQVRTRPFNLDVFVTVNNEKLFVGFSNLD